MHKTFAIRQQPIGASVCRWVPCGTCRRNRKQVNLLPLPATFTHLPWCWKKPIAGNIPFWPECELQILCGVRRRAKLSGSSPRLETPSHKWLVLTLLLLLLLLVSTAVYWLRRAKEQVPPRLEQITRYSSGHDVTAVALSRNGDQLAYATIDGGFFVRDNRTRKVRELIGPEHLTCYQLLFANDQYLLAIGSAGGSFAAWRIPLNSEPPKQLSDDVQLAALSHSGQEIAWLNAAHQVWAGANLGRPARLLVEMPRGTHVAALFWSGDDKRLWFHRLSGCRDERRRPDVTINPDFCQSSESGERQIPARVTPRFRSDHFASTPAFSPLPASLSFCARISRATARRSISGPCRRVPERDNRPLIQHKSLIFPTRSFRISPGQPMAGHSLWFAPTAQPRSIRRNGSLNRRPRFATALRLTFEESYNYPHTWSADSQSVIFESGRNAHLEIFRQNRHQRQPELLASSERENYYPQLSPDGKWILFMSARKTRDAGFTDLRLIRTPIDGGPLSVVPLGEALDEFRCSLPGVGKICVLRTSHGGQQAYWELDPVKGKGRELGRTSLVLVGQLGRWALSADGTHVAIPDDSGPGRFTELRLDSDPSKREQVSRQVSGMDAIISGMNPGHSNGEWLAWTDPESRKVPQSAVPPFSLGPSQFSALYFVDAHLHAYLLQNDSLHAFGVFSPDAKHVVVIRDELTSNLWSFVR